MSGSLAYGVGGGGLDRFDKEINFGAIKKGAAPLFKKNTYVDPLKRLSWPKRGSKSRSNSVETPADQAATSPKTASKPAAPTVIAESTATPSQLSDSVQPSPNHRSQLEISYHSLDSTSPAPQLSAILSLSNTIFNAQPDSTKYSSLSTWQTHLTSPSSIVFFATVPFPDNDADVEPVGFIYAFPRKPSDYPDDLAEKLHGEQTGQIFHIWLGGVLEKYRGRGLFEELMELVEGWAAERGFAKLSVSTVPEKFGRMFDLLKRKGWSVVEEMEAEKEGKVVLMKDVTVPEEVGVAR